MQSLWRFSITSPKELFPNGFLEYVKFTHRRIYRMQTLILKFAWFLCKLHREMLHNSKLSSSPKVNLLSAAWNCMHKRLCNSILCKRVPILKEISAGARCAWQIDREFFLLLSSWMCGNYWNSTRSPFSPPHQHTRDKTSMLLCSKHNIKYTPFGFDELYVRQSSLKHPHQDFKIISMQQN